MYSLYIVDKEDVTSTEEMGFDMIKNISIDRYSNNSMSSLLETIVVGLNKNMFIPADNFFICDEINGIVLYS